MGCIRSTHWQQKIDYQLPFSMVNKFCTSCYNFLSFFKQICSWLWKVSEGYSIPFLNETISEMKLLFCDVTLSYWCLISIDTSWITITYIHHSMLSGQSSVSIQSHGNKNPPMQSLWSVGLYTDWHGMWKIVMGLATKTCNFSRHTWPPICVHCWGTMASLASSNKRNQQEQPQRMARQYHWGTSLEMLSIRQSPSFWARSSVKSTGTASRAWWLEWWFGKITEGSNLWLLFVP